MSYGGPRLLAVWRITGRMATTGSRCQQKIVSSTPCLHRTFHSTSVHLAEKASKSAVEASQQQPKDQIQTSFATKTKDNAKTASYGLVIVVGVGVTGVILYTVLNELFSSNSPNALYEKASKQCVQHPQVQDLLGEPIKAYGEESRRGRRNRVSHLVYQDDEGRKGVRVQFYLQGRRNRGVAQLDAREDSSGNMQTRFLLVTVEDFLRNSIIVQDNR